MVPYLLRDVTAHQLLPRFVGMQPVAQIAPATGRLLKLFGDTTVGVTVYQLHGKRPAQLTQDGNLLQIQCIVFGVAESACTRIRGIGDNAPEWSEWTNGHRPPWC